MRRRDRNDQRAASLELDELLRREPGQRVPSTYGLSRDELVIEARRLVADGVSVADVCLMLAIEPPGNSTRRAA